MKAPRACDVTFNRWNTEFARTTLESNQIIYDVLILYQSLNRYHDKFRRFMWRNSANILFGIFQLNFTLSSLYFFGITFEELETVTQWVNIRAHKERYFSFSAHSESTTERSYRMCYLNHTNQALHIFYLLYFVLVLRVLILLNYFNWVNRKVAAAGAACCCCHYCSLLRLFVPFDDWSRGTDRKHQETTSTAAATKQFKTVSFECVFGVSMCVLCVLSYHQLGVFGDAMF